MTENCMTETENNESESSISPDLMLELEELWDQLDPVDQLAISGEVAVRRIMRLALWKRILIIGFTLTAAFEIALLMSRSWPVAFVVGMLAGLACGLLIRKS